MIDLKLDEIRARDFIKMSGSQDDEIGASEIAKKIQSIEYILRVKMKFSPIIIFTMRKRLVAACECFQMLDTITEFHVARSLYPTYYSLPLLSVAFF